MCVFSAAHLKAVIRALLLLTKGRVFLFLDKNFNMKRGRGKYHTSKEDTNLR